MKNYTYGWKLKEMGCVEVPEGEYTESMNDMKEYINMLSDVVVKAKCGWDSVKFKVLKYMESVFGEFMVLYVDGHDERWIPITGNSKGCNFSVLGENLW